MVDIKILLNGSWIKKTSDGNLQANNLTTLCKLWTEVVIT